MVTKASSKKNPKVLPVIDTAKKQEKAYADLISDTPSTARETGTVAQSFSRILGFEATDVGIRVLLRPLLDDPRTEIIWTFQETLARIVNMKKLLKIVPFEDPKATAEMVVMLERRLLEALQAADKALPQ